MFWIYQTCLGYTFFPIVYMNIYYFTLFCQPQFCREMLLGKYYEMFVITVTVTIIITKLYKLFLQCFLFLFLQAECQNHIRIVAKMDKEKLLLCGTQAYRPRCRSYILKVSYNKIFYVGAFLQIKAKYFHGNRYVLFLCLIEQ